MHRRAWSAVVDHLGLVAGMFDELGIGDELDRALQHNPETRIVTVGSAVKAMGLHGLGLVHQPLDLGPMFFQNKPTQCLIAPGIEAQHLPDDTLGRALEVYAALEDRIRQALKDQEATCPNQKGPPIQNPTARWVFQYFVGIPLLRIPGEGAFVLHLKDQHQQLLRLLGRSYEAFYS